MGRLYGVWQYGLVCVLVIGLGGYLAGQVALRTRYSDHPDEFIHVDAFCYFEVHPWMPPLDLMGLDYGPEGASRVYNAEVVYWVYGRADAGLQWVRDRLTTSNGQVLGPVAPLIPQQFLPVVISPGKSVGPLQHPCLAARYLDFRLFNTALFLITLGVLFAVGVQQAWAAAIGLGLVCLPQVIYIYAYAVQQTLIWHFGPLFSRPWGQPVNVAPRFVA